MKLDKAGSYEVWDIAHGKFPHIRDQYEIDRRNRTREILRETPSQASDRLRGVNRLRENVTGHDRTPHPKKDQPMTKYEKRAGWALAAACVAVVVLSARALGGL